MLVVLWRNKQQQTSWNVERIKGKTESTERKTGMILTNHPSLDYERSKIYEIILDIRPTLQHCYINPEYIYIFQQFVEL